ncbi:MAG: hypothetical protein JXQ75_19660 [Phycisphaerae bacterium]|nr:hypothetical protein [Phycisphaerae bacterium]
MYLCNRSMINQLFFWLAVGCVLSFHAVDLLAQDAIIIDHNDTDITALSEAAISNAKARLHIGYGHTSHGSQLTDGMTGLIGFANGGGLGLSFPTDFFAWNNGGSGGALDLEEGDGYGSGWLDHDCGYYPNWVNETRDYLDDPSHSDVNVIIWSWCGQVGGKYAAGVLDDEYLIPMAQLEVDYSDVTFVYMTGHVDHWDDGDNKAANQMIRDFCITNGKVLYDFADIESYDPDGTYFEFPHDNCDYYESESGPLLGNWATEWQNTHMEDVDWYSCTCAHSVALNCNRKAYAAWALWVAIAVIPGDMDCSGEVDITNDLPLFIEALLDPTGYVPPPDCTIEPADVNGDGDINGEDIDGFVDVLID